MHIVTISPKFQVVIPKKIRERRRLSPGQKVQAIVYDGRVELIPLLNPSAVNHVGRIELIPLRPTKDMRGFLAGIDTDVEREADRV